MTVDLSIPRTQRAALSYSKKTPTVVEEIPVVQPEALEPGQALVKVLYSGVCHVGCLTGHTDSSLIFRL